METIMEKEPKFERKPSVINQQEIQDFIKDRNIQPEDFHLIEKLAASPKNLIIMELHNMFNMCKDRSGKDLENLIKTSKDENKKELYEVALEFYQKYDWPASWDLVRLLEKL